MIVGIYCVEKKYKRATDLWLDVKQLLTWKCIVIDSHFDVLMVLLGVRRLIVQRLENKMEQINQLYLWAVQHIVFWQSFICYLQSSLQRLVDMILTQIKVEFQWLRRCSSCGMSDWKLPEAEKNVQILSKQVT